MRSVRVVQRGEGGFTLIELAVVMIILGILAAIAISTYFVQASKASRQSAVSALRQMQVTAETLRADSVPPGYSGDPVAYESEQPAYTYLPGTVASDDPNTVSVTSDGSDWVSFAAQGGGTCFYLRIELDADELFKHRQEVDGPVTCRATEYDPANTANDGW